MIKMFVCIVVILLILWFFSQSKSSFEYDNFIDIDEYQKIKLNFKERYITADKNQKIELIKIMQKGLEFERAYDFAVSVNELCKDSSGNLPSDKKIRFENFQKNLSFMDEPLGVAGVYGSAAGFYSLIKDAKIGLHQVHIFDERFLEAVIIILNDGKPVFGNEREQFLKKFNTLLLLIYPSYNIFSEDVTYNADIRAGKVEMEDRKDYVILEKVGFKSRFGGRSFMKEELLELLK